MGAAAGGVPAERNRKLNGCPERPARHGALYCGNDMNAAELDGCRLALVWMAESRPGVTAMSVLTGVARLADGHLVLERDQGRGTLPVPDMLLSHARPPAYFLKRLWRDADYYIPLQTDEPLPGADLTLHLTAGTPSRPSAN